MKSIQSKFLTVIISGMLILALAVSLLSIIYTGKLLERDSHIITESVASTEALRINDALKEVEHSARLMENYVLSSLSDPSKLSDEAFRNNYCDVAKIFYYGIANECENAISYCLRFAPELTDNFAGFYVARATTNANFSNMPTSNLREYETDPDLFWFNEPKTLRQAIWTEPYHDVMTGAYLISYLIPIYVNYDFIGVTGIDIAFSELTSMVSEVSVYDNGFAYLVSSDGESVLFSNVEDEIFERAHTVHGYAEEHITLDNGMELVIHADYSDIQSAGYRVVWMICIIVFVLMACFIVITYIFTRRIISPLKNLTVAAEEFADGRFDVRIDSCDAKDEIGALARAFEKTAVKMKGYTSYINALAYKDSLTGLKNRAAYNDCSNDLDVKIKRAECEPFAVLVADINGLKAANDRYGHEIGNKLIIKSARAICDAFKHSPVFRIGGDEFAVILRNEDFEHYAELLERMDSVCASSTVEVGENEIAVSVARAVAVYDERTDTSFEDVFNRADRKMYKNKRAMRDEPQA